MAGPGTRNASEPTPTGLLVRVVAPPLIGFVLLAGYVGAEALGFRGLARQEAETVSEAAAEGRAARALELIAAGQHPDALLHVRPGVLDADGHELRPVEAAILGRHEELVRLLRRSGATEPGATRGACLARARLPEVLSEFGAPSTESPDSLVDVATALRICSTAS
jgi:hypothetical protein